MSTRSVSDDYAGAFDPEWSLARLSRAALARVAREVIDPLLPDDYVRYGVAVDRPDRLRLWIEPSVRLDDDVCRSPLSWLHEPDRPGFEHVAQAVNPRARVRPLDPGTIDEGPAALAWEIVIDPDAEPVAEHWAAAMVAGGTIARIDLTARAETPVVIGS